MADDDDTIYVDVAARLDEDAAEKATGRLRDKLKDGVKGAGQAIGKVIHSEMAQELSRAIEPMARNAGEEIAKSLGKKVGGFLRDELRDELKGVGVDLDGITDKARELADQWGINEENVSKLSDAFKGLKTGDTAKGVDDLAKALSGVPGPIGDVAQKSGDLLDKFSSLKTDIKSTSDEFSTFAGNSPKFAAAFETIGKAIGPIAADLAVISALDKDFAGDMDKLFTGIQQHDLSKILQGGGGMAGDSLYDYSTLFGAAPLPWDSHQFEKHSTTSVPRIGPNDPNGPRSPLGTMLVPGQTGPAPSGPPTLGGIGPIPGLTVGPGVHTSSATIGGGTHVSLVDYTTPTLPSIASPRDLPAAGGGVKNLYQVAQALQGTPYSQKLRNDCSGMVSQLAAAAVGLPPPGAGQRFSTDNEGQWLSQHGFAVDQGAAPAGSFQIGWHNGGPSGGHTAATLPGGVNAESGGSVGSFTLGGGVGANSPQFEHHAYLPMGAPTASSGGGAMPAGFGSPGGLGLPGLGAYPPPPTQGNSYTPQTQQGLGHGQGLSVSGGAIGLAEQAGAMAAGAFSFGGGAIAAQVAEQEMNLAIQKGGQMAAVAAMAPVETLGLAGGQMGAPSVQNGGWYKKIVGGLIGQTTNIANSAGASTQPPKDPKDPNQQQGDEQGQQQGQGGPSGSQDDPMHVKVTNTQPPPQGSATSALNTTGVMSGTTV